jgi:ribosomal protein S18 acetylase RimI-like enzyme
MKKATEILIPNAPEVPGLTFRGFRGDADYPVMVDILSSVNLADNENNSVSVEEIAVQYKHIQRSDLHKDMVFVEIDGQVIGYGRCQWDQESEGDYLYSFFFQMSPAGRGKGIERPIFEYFIDRMKEISKGHPAEAAKFFQTWSQTTRQQYNREVEALGFTPARYIIGMVRPCSLSVEITPLPEGIEVRPVEESHMRQIFEAENEAFLDHWGSIDPTETDYQRWLELPLHKPELWKVAWDGDQVVGMVRNYINKAENEDFKRKRGYTEEISVRRPWRRKGVARALLTRSIQMFIEMGMDETSLGVDTENPSGAFKLYTDVGYSEEKRYITYRKSFFNNSTKG